MRELFSLCRESLFNLACMEPQLENMFLVDDEDAGLVFRLENAGEGIENLELCLVGRFISNRPIRSHIMKKQMRGIWRTGKRVSIREVEQGLFIF